MLWISKKAIFTWKLEHPENFWTMKTKVENKKDFDAVELMQKRRIQIGKDIQGMSFEEEKAYFQESTEKLKKYKMVPNNLKPW